jgi:hypothetical protein
VRRTSLIVTIAAHVGLFAILMIPVAQPVRVQAASLKLFDVKPGPPEPETNPQKPRQPVPVPPQPTETIVVPPPIIPLPVPSAVVVALLEQSDQADQGGACDLTGPVQAALEESVDVQMTLPRIPLARRSVANAIMIWNLDWVTSDDRLDVKARETIRDVVAGTIAAASPECRLQPQGGPRLVILPGEDGNTVLALGSGQWRWQDLLETARPGWSDDQLLASAKPALIMASADDASAAR